MESGNQTLSKIKLLIKEYCSKFIFSLGMGGFLSLYIIEFFRVNVITNLKETEDLYKLFVDMNITGINSIEIYILVISIVSIIAAPLLSKKDSKRSLEVFFLITLFIFEIICTMSVIVHQNINNLFILGTTITSIYIVWIGLDILKIIYYWTKIDRTAERQVDVTKLTLIWAIIAFILSLLR